MAVSSRRMNEAGRRRAFTLILSALLLHNAVHCQEAETDMPILIMTGPTLPFAEAQRGDGDPIPDVDTPAPDVDPADTDPTGSVQNPTAGPADTDADIRVQTIVFPTIWEVDSSQTAEAGTPAPPEGDSLATTGPGMVLDTLPAEFWNPVVIDGESGQNKADVQCVDKEAVLDRDAVKLELTSTTSCEDTKARIVGVIEDLCGEDCALKIFQEENSHHIIVSGQNIEADAKGMADKFSSEGIKDQLGVVEAVPRWGKHPPTVLVSLLLTGLLLAALLIGGYCLKHHRAHHAKGIRLAEESFPVDEENQGNTLVSVAPLPQEPQQKPSANGESPDGGKPPAPDTNGPSATQTPVADTEL
ncbi:uncharacterized protein si:ch211-286o17.1 [Megalops cyprinoides]|uniref:uncharacterized protein si:ch211-286o17.1 n=1 Tax=Megalops cyprinoides TaxID=118141 RepID=UPI00186547E8|nr:uncharacterized protein si:ch211-286o17.1 [Megalops cyprinoides]